MKISCIYETTDGRFVVIRTLRRKKYFLGIYNDSTSAIEARNESLKYGMTRASRWIPDLERKNYHLTKFNKKMKELGVTRTLDLFEQND